MKCFCGNPSTVEIIADYDNREGLFGLDGIARRSGYPSWSFVLGKYKAYPCDSCALALGDRLDEIDECGYEMRRSDRGYWKCDLP